MDTKKSSTLKDVKLSPSGRVILPSPLPKVTVLCLRTVSVVSTWLLSRDDLSVLIAGFGSLEIITNSSCSSSFDRTLRIVEPETSTGNLSTVVNEVSLVIVATSNLLTVPPVSITSIRSPSLRSEENPVFVPFTVIAVVALVAESTVTEPANFLASAGKISAI